MAAKKQLPFDFIVEQLKKNKNATYAEIQAAAARKGLVIHPINYGRAKLMLGLVTSKTGGKKAAKKGAAKKKAGKKVARTTAAAQPARRGPGRPRKQPATAGGDMMSIIEQVRQNDAERQRYRRALEKIRAALAEID